MNEFDVKDYDEARKYADNIKAAADRIMDVFERIDKVNRDLYERNWRSEGSENALTRYKEIRKNYQTFYDRVVLMRTHVYNVTTTKEESDKRASETMTSI